MTLSAENYYAMELSEQEANQAMIQRGTSVPDWAHIGLITTTPS